MLGLLMSPPRTPATVTAHQMSLSLLPVALLALTGASYVTAFLMVFNARLKPIADQRLEDSRGRPAFPIVDANGAYVEEREICSGPQTPRLPMRECRAEAVPSTECPRCVDGRCQARTEFSLSAPGEFWLLVGLPAFRCVEPASSCRRFLERSPGQVEFNASTEHITAQILVPGPPDSLRLCATARYYPPWTIDDLNSERRKEGRPPYPSPRDIFLGRWPPKRQPPANR